MPGKYALVLVTLCVELCGRLRTTNTLHDDNDPDD